MLFENFKQGLNPVSYTHLKQLDNWLADNK